MTFDSSNLVCLLCTSLNSIFCFARAQVNRSVELIQVYVPSANDSIFPYKFGQFILRKIESFAEGYIQAFDTAGSARLFLHVSHAATHGGPDTVSIPRLIVRLSLEILHELTWVSFFALCVCRTLALSVTLNSNNPNVPGACILLKPNHLKTGITLITRITLLKTIKSNPALESVYVCIYVCVSV